MFKKIVVSCLIGLCLTSVAFAADAVKGKILSVKSGKMLVTTGGNNVMSINQDNSSLTAADYAAFKRGDIVKMTKGEDGIWAVEKAGKK